MTHNPTKWQKVLCGLSIIAASMAGPSLAFSDENVRNRVADWFDPKVSADSHDGQYMRQDCVKADQSEFRSNWSGFPVEKCSYTTMVYGVSVTTTAYIIFPSSKQLATWIVDACVDAKTQEVETCAGRLASRIWQASNAQFAVAGYVVEPPQSDTWKYPSQPYCYLFRDGVTVTTKSWPETRRQIDNACGPAKANQEPMVKAFRFARVGSTSRADYVNAGGAENVGTDDDKSPEWATVSGSLFKEALKSENGKNFLLFALAKSGLNRCDGNIFETPRIPASCK